MGPQEAWREFFRTLGFRVSLNARWTFSPADRSRNRWKNSLKATEVVLRDGDGFYLHRSLSAMRPPIVGDRRRAHFSRRNEGNIGRK